MVEGIRQIVALTEPKDAASSGLGGNSHVAKNLR
jgi:hypothetical protein